MTGASNRELLAHERLSATPEGLKLEEQFLKDHPEARSRIFAVLLQRSVFSQGTFNFFVGRYGRKCHLLRVRIEVKAFALQALGYFVGLWAVRQMLVAGGPKVFTIVDYTVLVLLRAFSRLSLLERHCGRNCSWVQSTCVKYTG
jgi:hypothetical protein